MYNISIGNNMRKLFFFYMWDHELKLYLKAVRNISLVCSKECDSGKCVALQHIDIARKTSLNWKIVATLAHAPSLKHHFRVWVKWQKQLQ